MKYKVTHTTTYTYSTPVSVCHNLVMLTPREDPRLHCQSHRLVIRPTPQVSARRVDYFGNHVHSFFIEQTHRELSVTSSSRVSVSPPALPVPEASPEWETVVAAVRERTDPNWLSACQFSFDSPRVSRSAEFLSYAESSFDRRAPVLQSVVDLTSRIHSDFEYDKLATSVTTPTDQAFRAGKGVCQDFAHIQVACLRSVGLPAQYVSGYLRTVPPPDKPRMIGADQSHAWVSVYCGSELGWVDVDPTNDVITSTEHVAIARGRDYGDVVPIKGVFLGGGEHQLDVSVDVAPQQ